MPGQRILIVDDEPNVRETMCLALQAVGYHAETAADGLAGLERFGTGEPWDLVLLDQRMPGMEGLEVLRRMRERDPGARIVMVTAYGSIELAVDAMRAGAVDFLRKPFTLDGLRGTVAGVLALPRPPEPEPSLGRLLPREWEQREQSPTICFRTLNGYRLWPEPGTNDTDLDSTARIARGFAVLAPDGTHRHCSVAISATLRNSVRAGTGQDLPPEHPLWDEIARTGLSHFLWERAEPPPETLTLHGLRREQLVMVCALVGLQLPR